MPYHPYIPSHEYKRDEVVAFLERHIASDAIENKYAAEEWLNDIRNCPHETIVWAPFAKSFGASPLDWRTWKTTTGEPICAEHVVNTTRSNKRVS